MSLIPTGSALHGTTHLVCCFPAWLAYLQFMFYFLLICIYFLIIYYLYYIWDQTLLHLGPLLHLRPISYSLVHLGPNFYYI